MTEQPTIPGLFPDQQENKKPAAPPRQETPAEYFHRIFERLPSAIEVKNNTEGVEEESPNDQKPPLPKNDIQAENADATTEQINRNLKRYPYNMDKE